MRRWPTLLIFVSTAITTQNLEPTLQVIAHDALGEVLEHLPFAPLAAQFYGLVADRQEALLVRLFRAEVKHPAAIG